MTGLDDFQGRIGYRLDGFQVDACRALESGVSVLVAAPTGAGKTTVAEFAIHLAMAGSSEKVFYTTPIKALSNQKFHELVSAYGEDQVGLLTGDTNVNSNARIVVMTTEVLRNMLYANSDTLTGLRYVVMDEVHYLADRFRGAVWEEVILHLPPSVQLVSLSATVSNAEEFGDWLQAVRGDTAVIVSEDRPVPLHQHVFMNGALVELFDPDGNGNTVNPEVSAGARNLQRSQTAMNRAGHGRAGRGRQGRNDWRRQSANRPVSRSAIVRTLDDADLLPAIFFIFSRAACEAAVTQLSRSGLRLTTAEDREEIRSYVDEALNGFNDDDLAALGYWEWLESLQRGYAAHHAGLLPVFKHIVEHLFQRKLVKVVFATETLALGINMPARTVVIEKLEKFNGEARVPLSPGEYTQLTGRAGRRRIDTEGHSVVVWSNDLEATAVAQLASRRTYPLRSSFSPSYNMAVNLIEQHGKERTRHILEASFAQFQADRSVVELAKQLQGIEASLKGYRDASAKETDGRWKKRAEGLEKDAQRLRRQIQRRTDSIARQFERVVFVLKQLEYLDSNDQVTPAGAVLKRIYGERDLLVAESLRRGLWNNLDATALAALVSTLVYEPRRETGNHPRHLKLSNAFATAFNKTAELWADLDDMEREQGMAGSSELALGLSSAVWQWASGQSLGAVLDIAEIPAGDFVRWAKQAIDVLEQIASSAEPQLATVAYEAMDKMKRGIVAL